MIVPGFSGTIESYNRECRAPLAMAPARQIGRRPDVRPKLTLSLLSRPVVSPNYPHGISALDRFWSRVDQSGGPDACWPWTGKRNKLGYGHLRYYGRKVPVAQVSLVAHGYLLSDDDFACHACDNPPCCNPAHLFPGSHVDNMADRDAKGRQAKGSTVGISKLTESQVAEIRHRYSNYETQPSLAADFGLTRSTINAIVRGTTWRHVPGLTNRSPRRGENHVGARLTWEKVREIRIRSAAGERYVDLGREFGVSAVTVRSIVIGTKWRDAA